MKHIKTYEELSPELLKRAAGDRDTPQKRRIGAEGDLRKNMQDPEYVAGLNKKKEEEQAKADKKNRIWEVIKKHFRDEKLYLFIKTVEMDPNYSNDKTVSVTSINTYINFDSGYTFGLQVGSDDDGQYFKGSLKEDGTIELDPDDVEEMVKYYKKNYKEVGSVEFRNVVELSIIGVELKTAVGFAELINVVYGTKLTKDNLKISNMGQSNKLGIYNKDFEELRETSHDYDEKWEIEDFESKVNALSKYGCKFYP